MSRAVKQLEAMKGDPHRGWTIEDVKQVCRSFGVHPYLPPGGGHYVLSHPAVGGLLTIPAARPLKPLYLLLLVDLVEWVIERKR